LRLPRGVIFKKKTPRYVDPRLIRKGRNVPAAAHRGGEGHRVPFRRGKLVVKEVAVRAIHLALIRLSARETNPGKKVLVNSRKKASQKKEASRPLLKGNSVDQKKEKGVVQLSVPCGRGK